VQAAWQAGARLTGNCALRLRYAMKNLLGCGHACHSSAAPRRWWHYAMLASFFTSCLQLRQRPTSATGAASRLLTYLLPVCSDSCRGAVLLQQLPFRAGPPASTAAAAAGFTPRACHVQRCHHRRSKSLRTSSSGRWATTDHLTDMPLTFKVSQLCHRCLREWNRLCRPRTAPALAALLAIAGSLTAPPFRSLLHGGPAAAGGQRPLLRHQRWAGAAAAGAAYLEAALQCTCGSFVLYRRVLQTASCMKNN
jgi:hypothetical protein